MWRKVQVFSTLCATKREPVIMHEEETCNLFIAYWELLHTSMSGLIFLRKLCSFFASCPPQTINVKIWVKTQVLEKVDFRLRLRVSSVSSASASGEIFWIGQQLSTIYRSSLSMPGNAHVRTSVREIGSIFALIFASCWFDDRREEGSRSHRSLSSAIQPHISIIIISCCWLVRGPAPRIDWGSKHIIWAALHPGTCVAGECRKKRYCITVSIPHANLYPNVYDRGRTDIGAYANRCNPLFITQMDRLLLTAASHLSIRLQTSRHHRSVGVNVGRHPAQIVLSK